MRVFNSFDSLWNTVNNANLSAFNITKRFKNSSYRATRGSHGRGYSDDDIDWYDAFDVAGCLPDVYQVDAFLNDDPDFMRWLKDEYKIEDIAPYFVDVGEFIKRYQDAADINRRLGPAQMKLLYGKSGLSGELEGLSGDNPGYRGRADVRDHFESLKGIKAALKMYQSRLKQLNKFPGATEKEIKEREKEIKECKANIEKTQEILAMATEGGAGWFYN